MNIKRTIIQRSAGIRDINAFLCEEGVGKLGSLVIRVARICTVSHYKTKPLSCASIGGKSKEVKSRSEKLWIGRRKSFLYKVTM